MATKADARRTRQLDRTLLLRAYRTMLTARLVDEADLRLKRQSRIYFQIGGAGHEAAQVAAAFRLKPGYDWFYPYYRDRTLALALGVTPTDMFLQAMGKPGDPSSGGREMPCHYGSPELNIVNQSSPTGTQYLQAVGTAEAGRIAARVPPSALRPSFQKDEIVYVSGGDGSVSEGEFYEAVCAASLKKLPVLFFIQNNGYAISVPVEEQTPDGNIAKVFSSTPGLLVMDIDGTDLFESYEEIGKAVSWCREGRGPALVHARVVRLCPHSDSDDESVYRTQADRESARAQDPIMLLEKRLVNEELATARDFVAIREVAEAEVTRAADRAAAEPDQEPGTVTRFIFDPDPRPIEEPPPAPDGAVITIVQAINSTLQAEMARDPRVVIFGEDVADVSRSDDLEELQGKGGVFKVTANLQRRFGSHRVFNTPITEAGIVGRAIGMAVRGLRPIVEIQFFDYIWPAMQQIRNELATIRWRSNNSFSAPVVVRVPTGGYLRGGALYHSQTGESIFCHCPGLVVVEPSNARDACGLLRASIRTDDPVLFLEHKHLYRQRYARTPDPGPDYIVPLGKARTVRPGKHVTVITYGAQVEMSVRAAESLAQEGIDVEVIDLRTLVPYDWDAIAASTKRTGRVVVVYEENRSFGFGAEIAARVAGELFDYLDAPVGRVASPDVYVPYSPILEKAALPQVEDVLEAIRRVAQY